MAGGTAPIGQWKPVVNGSRETHKILEACFDSCQPLLELTGRVRRDAYRIGEVPSARGHVIAGRPVLSVGIEAKDARRRVRRKARSSLSLIDGRAPPSSDSRAHSSWTPNRLSSFGMQAGDHDQNTTRVVQPHYKYDPSAGRKITIIIASGWYGGGSPALSAQRYPKCSPDAVSVKAQAALRPRCINTQAVSG